MKNSKIIVDINSKDDVLAIGKIVDGEITVNSYQQKHAPVICTLFDGVTSVMAALLKSDKAGQRVAIIVPENIAVRMNEARATIKNGAEEVANSLLKDWMLKDEENVAIYSESIGNFASTYEEFVSVYGSNYIFINARQLYRYELEGNLDQIEGLETIKLNNSVNTELGVCVKKVGKTGTMENNMLTGTFTLNFRKFRRRNGEMDQTVFVNRQIAVLDKDKETARKVDTPRVLELLDAGEIVLNDRADAATALVNALRLRAANIELGLPHVKVIKEIPTLATDGTLTF